MLIRRATLRGRPIAEDKMVAQQGRITNYRNIDPLVYQGTVVSIDVQCGPVMVTMSREEVVELTEKVKLLEQPWRRIRGG